MKYSKTDFFIIPHHPPWLVPRLEALDVRLVAVHLIATCPRPFGESPVPSWESPRSKSLVVNWLVVTGPWLDFTTFQKQLGRIIPTDELRCFRGLGWKTTKQLNQWDESCGNVCWEATEVCHVPCAATRIRPCASMRIDTSRPCFCGCLNDATAGFPQSSSNTMPTASGHCQPWCSWNCPTSMFSPRSTWSWFRA